MRVLIAHKLWHVKGGVERYVIGLQSMLEKRGHEVVPFTCAHPMNLKTGYESFFPPYRDLSKPRLTGDAPKAAANFFYSREARQAVSRLLDEFRPDVVHCRNIYHHLSPSILAEFRKRDIPVLMTVADYKLICPNYRLFRGGEVCEDCKGGRYYNAVRGRCVKGSLPASTLCAAENAFHDATGAYVDRLQRILAPSAFTRDKLAEFGIPNEKLAVLRHFIDADAWRADPSRTSTGTASGRPYVLSFGRLTDEKGVDRAIEAMRHVSGVDLVIVGEGPMEEELRRLADDRAPGKVTFRGYMDADQLREVIADSLAVVVPSIWYEVFGFSILESFSLGKPVIGSRMGAIPELVVDGVTGFTFDPSSPEDLAAKISLLAAEPSLARSMGSAARELVQVEFGEQHHYDALMVEYQALLNV